MKELEQIKFPDHSRVWVYQADRFLSADEKNIILQQGKEFTNTWAAHGNDLLAELYIAFDLFVIIVLDEKVESASGCSIDKSVKLILDFENRFGISLTNRLISAIYKDEKPVLVKYATLREEVLKGNLTGESMVFDNTILTVNDLKNSWLKPINNTWLKKHVSSENVS